MTTLKFENKRLHVIVWIAYIVYDRIYYFYVLGNFANFWDYVVYYFINISLFYINAHIVLPVALTSKQNKYLRLVGAVLAEAMIYIICRYAFLNLLNLFNIAPSPRFTTNRTFISNGIIRFVYFLGLSTGYWFALTTYYNRKKINDLEQTKLQDELNTQSLEKALLLAENAYLKSQINPHFLLNTLNFLRDSISKYSEQVAGSFTTLSEIMRYALASAGDDGKVPLESELKHIVNFITLNQARFSQRLQIDFIVNGDPKGLRIIPLVLITMVENLFKYGDLLNEAFPAKIFATIDENNLTFVTHNLKKKKVTERSHGIGIQNIKNRLANYHSFELDIDDDGQVYKSTLKIQL